MEALAAVDTKILLWLNGWVGHFGVVDRVASALASDYLVLVLGSLTMLGLWFWGSDAESRQRHQRAVLTGMIALGLASLAVAIINDAYVRPRPFLEHDLALLFYRPTDPSFPANPVAVAFAMAAGVFTGHRRAGAMLYLLAALLALSRVYAGVFYPSDVAAGAAIGVVMAYLVRLALRLIEPVPTLVLRLARALYLA